MREPDLQPTLKGTLLWLRPMRPDDLEPLYEVARDPLIWAQHPDWDRYRRHVFEAVFRAGLESGGALVAPGLLGTVLLNGAVAAAAVRA